MARARRVLDLIRQKLVSQSDVRGTLERLYRVSGFDGLALRLMWVGESCPEHRKRDLARFLDLHADDVYKSLAGACPGAEPPVPASLPGLIADIGRRAREMSHAVERVRGHDRAENILSLLAEDVEALRLFAHESNRSDIVRFCDSLHSFFRYVTTRHLEGDVRIERLVETACVALQTQAGGGLPADRDALENVVSLLLQPEILFETPIQEGT
jgi:hypothetical protein